MTDCTALITGASSGFGLLTSVTLAGRGWHVLATMRDLSRRTRLEAAAQAAGVLDRIEFLQLDVTRQEEIDALSVEVSKRKAPLDAIVNNAGFALAGFVDDVSDAELRRQFDTNFFAATAVTRSFLPQMRRQGFGHIVMVSSISGRCGFPGISSYAASKHALEGWTESLRFEVAPLGIQVALVEPGSFETDIWSRNAVIAKNSLDAHSPNAARLAAWKQRLLQAKKRPDPQQVADGIARILEAKRPRLRTVFGADAKLLLVLRALLPGRVYERLIKKASGMER
ncbi:SDR family oxidoreductase [Telmatobacter bradus]|uniref:SDR family oxidoreductase n=1 Tax=Telmatobacter bradus TaxID=474953 RepID=UPI003B430A0E